MWLKISLNKSWDYGWKNKHTEFDSPEVDPEVLILAGDEKLEIGEFYQVKINDADDFDLYAEVIK